MALSSINAGVIITAVMGVICSTTAPVGTRLHLSTGSRTFWVNETHWHRVGLTGELKHCSQHTRIHRCVAMVEHWAFSVAGLVTCVL